MRKVLRYFSILLVLELLICLVGSIPAYAASLDLDDTEGYVEDEIDIDGSGFAANEDITLYFNDDEIESYEADDDGEFSDSFEVPELPGGDYDIVAKGDSSGTQATESFEILPQITLGATSGESGDSVTVYGTGFDAEEEITILFVDDEEEEEIGEDESDEDGSWSSSVEVPSGYSSGTYYFDAESDEYDADDVDDVSFKVTSVSTISVSPSSGTVGSSVTVSGTGFTSGESVSIKFDSTTVVSSFTLSSASFSKSFTVPASSYDDHTITITGSKAGSSTTSFSINPKIIAAPTSGSVGSVVTVTGSGFASGETVTLKFDGSPVNTNSINVESNGAWSSSFTVPSSVTSGTSHSISASGSTSGNTSSLAFGISAGIKISPSSGAVGSQVTINGSGFTANSSVTIKYDNNAVSTASTDSTGSFSLTLTVPASASGVAHTIAATEGSSNSSASFAVTPKITVNTNSGSSGSSVTVTGSGFARGETVTVYYDGESVGSPATASVTGAWTANIIVPTSTSGTHSISAKGSATQAAAVEELPFKTTAGISFIYPSNMSEGSVGASITINGTGFTPNSSLQIFFDDITLAAVSADASGSFSKAVTIPRTTAGSHTLKVIDSQNNTTTKPFVVDSKAPAAPKLTSPEDGTRIGLTGNITPDFKWAAVTDPSGVTYALQIDSDSEFSNPVLDKTDISTNHYTPTKSYALKRGAYYWRVKAIDGAGNESAWSQPMLLSSGLMPAGLLFLIIILVLAAIVIVLYIFVLKPYLRKRVAKAPARGEAAPEIVIPEVVNAEYRTLDTEDSGKKKALPWRLALPQAPQPTKTGKGLSTEDQARLKVIIDFAKSLPLVEPGSDTGWLVEMAESGSGNIASPTLYSQILKGEIQPRYEPAWMRHPTFADLQTLLEGQPILQDLDSFIDSVNRTSAEALSILQEINKDTTSEISWDIIANGGWAFISAVYTDSIGWFLGKNLREPSDRDYIVKTTGIPGEENNIFELYGEQNTSFRGLLIKAPDEKEATALRVLHLKLRRNYRNSEKARDIVSMLSQMDVQRARLVSSFNQFNRLNT